MRATLVVVLSVMFAAGLCGMVVAGSLEPTGPPTAGSGMYTLQNLYDYIVSGTALEAKTSFQEPSAAPGSTMKTTKEIGDALRALYDQCNVTADNVELGKRFFCTQPGSWGVQTGTLSALPRLTATPTITITPTPTITPIPWGPTPCATYGGYWAPLNGGLVGNGCWFNAAWRQSCTDACDGRGGLVCDQRQWNDDSSCSIMKAIKTSGDCHVDCGGQGPGYGPASPAWGANGAVDQCIYRSTGVQDCAESLPYDDNPGWGTRICVCESQ